MKATTTESKFEIKPGITSICIIDWDGWISVVTLPCTAQQMQWYSAADAVCGMAHAKCAISRDSTHAECMNKQQPGQSARHTCASVTADTAALFFSSKELRIFE